MNDFDDVIDMALEVAHAPRNRRLHVPLELTDEQTCAITCGEYHHDDCPIGKKLRDCWCTPGWLTDLLPRVDLDPCSNPFSTVNASLHLMLEDPLEGCNNQSTRACFGQGDGLAEDWRGKSVFVNPPYSNIKPWARKAIDAKAFIFLINNVTTTRWYHELVRNGGSYKFEFAKRLKFDPPPRIKPSSNNRDQVLVCNREGWQMIGNRLDGYGRWWVEQVGYISE